MCMGRSIVDTIKVKYFSQYGHVVRIEKINGIRELFPEPHGRNAIKEGPRGGGISPTLGVRRNLGKRDCKDIQQQKREYRKLNEEVAWFHMYFGFS